MAVTQVKVYSRANLQVWDVTSTANNDVAVTIPHARGKTPDYVTLTTRLTQTELWVLSTKSNQTVLCNRLGISGGDASVQLTVSLHWAERHGV